jgi:hypothetical protein
MKPLTLFLIIVIISFILSSGCMDTTAPPKKVVTPPVTTTTAVTTAVPLPPSPASVGFAETPGPTQILTPMVTGVPDDMMIPDTTNEAPNLRILKTVEVRPEVGKLTITGIAKNEGKISVPVAEIQIKFFDANNNLITSSKTSTENFDAGGTWGFTVVYPGPDSRKVASYKITITPV